MIRILSNCHTHTTYCDGMSTMREMTEAAVNLHFDSLGFSGHAPQYFDPPYCMSPANEKLYREECVLLRKEYGDRIRIWLGTERDFYSCTDPDRYDYYIASVHYLPHHGAMIAVDGSADDLKLLLKERYGGNGLKLTRDYYEHVAVYAMTRRPPIIGHLDLIKKNNQYLGLFDEGSSDYRGLVLETLSFIRASGAMLEVNTGGMAKGYLKDPYPSSWILEEWRKMGGEVIISSDCHDKAKLDYAFDRIPEDLLKLGFFSVKILGSGSELFVTQSLI